MSISMLLYCLKSDSSQCLAAVAGATLIESLSVTHTMKHKH